MNPSASNNPQPTAEQAAKASAPDVQPTVDTSLGGKLDATATHLPRLENGAADSQDQTVPNNVSVPGYEIQSVLGRGAMGVVYKARQLALKRVVALKMILAGGHAGPREIARFRVEAEAVARLQHPNIVQIYEVGEADGHPYCALEYVEGGNLAARLERQPMQPREAAQIVQTLARGMQAAHSKSVVHRDLKPANVLLAADGTPKITDFGLARQLDTDSGQTQAGAVMGTPSYMAPEQASGLAHEAGPAVDIYALGAILYECLTGRPPLQGKNVAETLHLVRSQEPVPPSRWQPKIPRDLETICLKALAKDPARRYITAEELADDLKRFLRDEPIHARRAGAMERAWRRVRRNPAVFGLTAIVLALAGTIAGVIVTRRDTSAEDLVKVVTDLDRTDPGWRLEQIEEKRAAIPEEQNGALQIVAFRKLVSELRGTPGKGEGQWTGSPAVLDRLATLDGEPPMAHLTENDLAIFRPELSRVTPALDLARKMAAYDRGRFQTAYKRDAVSTLLDDHSAARHMANLLQLDFLVRLEDGDKAGALATLQALLRTSQAFGDDPVAIAQLIRIAIFRKGLLALQRLLARTEISDGELHELQKLLTEADATPVLVTMARGDRGATHYLLSSLAAGDLTDQALMNSLGIQDPSKIPRGRELRLFHAWLLQHQTEFAAIAHEPPERQIPALAVLDQKDAGAPLSGTPLFEVLTQNPLTSPGASPMSTASSFAAQVRRHLAEVRCALAALAAERYRLANGTWPENLATAVPAYMAEVPKDPYDGEPLRYQRTADGAMVYALGPDLADDQGKLQRVGELGRGVDIGFQLWDAERRR